jgi:hypothetical protein
MAPARQPLVVLRRRFGPIVCCYLWNVGVRLNNRLLRYSIV